MNDAILVVNAGSSSIKCALFACQEQGLERVYQADITGIGTHTLFKVKTTDGDTLHQQDLGAASHDTAFRCLLDWSEHRDDGYQLRGIGHRVVHGGTRFVAPVLVNAEILTALEALIPLAPLHQPHNLKPIHTLHDHKPDLPQVACFDTAFHATQPPVAQQFAIPHEHTEAGVRRYGFHGQSYAYIAQRLPELAGAMPDNTIVAHLGNGASLAALKAGKSIATTMGFSALDGLMMGTRCGAIDPGVLLHWLQNGMTAQDIEKTLYHQSGLLGVSGISNDMQDLLDNPEPRAQQAVDLFVYRISREIGSLAAALGGVDALVFTAGIGEHAAAIRTRICAQAAWLGVALDTDANARHAQRIDAQNSRVSVWVIPTDEEKMIAQQTRLSIEHGE